MTPVGHDAAQAPQVTHRAKNARSLSAPGGRIASWPRASRLPPAALRTGRHDRGPRHADQEAAPADVERGCGEAGAGVGQSRTTGSFPRRSAVQLRQHVALADAVIAERLIGALAGDDAQGAAGAVGLRPVGSGRVQGGRRRPSKRRRDRRRGRKTSASRQRGEGSPPAARRTPIPPGRHRLPESAALRLPPPGEARPAGPANRCGLHPNGPNEDHDQDEVFDREPPPVAVDLRPLSPVRTRDPRHQVLECAQRTDPATEEPAEHRGGSENHDAQARPSLLSTSPPVLCRPRSGDRGPAARTRPFPETRKTPGQRRARRKSTHEEDLGQQVADGAREPAPRPP